MLLSGLKVPTLLAMPLAVVFLEETGRKASTIVGDAFDSDGVVAVSGGDWAQSIN